MIFYFQPMSNLKIAVSRVFVPAVAALLLSSCGLIGQRGVNEPFDDFPLPPTSIQPIVQPVTSFPTQPINNQALDARRTAALNAILREGAVGAYTVGQAYSIEGRRYVPQENLGYTERGLASWYGPGLGGNITSNGERFNPNAHTIAHRTLPFSSIVRITNLRNNRSTMARVNDRGPFLRDHIADLSQATARDLGIVETKGNQVLVEVLEAETREVARVTGRSVGFFSGRRNSVTSINPSSVLLPTVAPVTPILPTVSSSSVTVAPIPAAPRLSSQPSSTRINNVALPPLPVQTPTRVTPVASVPTSVSAPAGQGSGYYVQAGSYSSRENAEQVRNKLSSVGNVVIFPVMVAGVQRFRVRVGPYSSRREAQSKLGTVIISGGPDAIVIKEG